MTVVDVLQRFHHDSGWAGLAAVTLLCVGLALAVLAYTAWSTPK